MSDRRKKIEALDGLVAFCLLWDNPDGWRAKDWGCLYQAIVILFRNDVEYHLALPEGVCLVHERSEGSQEVFTLNDLYGATRPIKITFNPAEPLELAGTLMTTASVPPPAIYHAPLPVADAPRPTGPEQLAALARLLTPVGASFAPM